MLQNESSNAGWQVRLPRIAVIGGGFAGAAFALHLARQTAVPAQLAIIEPRSWIGGGVAYSSTDPTHRTNVPAANMSVYAEDETHFDRWVRTNGAVAGDPEAKTDDGSIFPRRQVFGTYVQSELVRALTSSQLDYVHLRDRVMAMRREANAWILTLARGREIEADVVVLAASHPPPEPPDEFREAAMHLRVISDPWATSALASIEPDEEVLIIGTGLTMTDIVASLDRRGHVGRIRAISRRGLLSRGYESPCPPRGDFTANPSRSAIDLVCRIRREIAAAAAEGQPWQAVIDAVRRDAFAIWTALDAAERGKLVRHLRAFWDVHRFRIAPQVKSVLDRRIENGTLQITPASVRSVHPGLREIETVVLCREPGGRREETIKSHAVILATGPGHSAIFTDDGVLAALAADGHIQPDGLGLGILVDLKSRPIGRDRAVSPGLFVAGPHARGTFGELMGLPEVARHAEALATQAVAWLVAQKAWAPEPDSSAFPRGSIPVDRSSQSKANLISS